MRPRAAALDSVPVGVPRMAGVPESLYVRLENREIYAKSNIYCGRQGGKTKTSSFTTKARRYTEF
jgi:hypothetical protein